jgi:hypothetical protein
MKLTDEHHLKEYVRIAAIETKHDIERSEDGEGVLFRNVLLVPTHLEAAKTHRHSIIIRHENFRYHYSDIVD